LYFGIISVFVQLNTEAVKEDILNPKARDYVVLA